MERGWDAWTMRAWQLGPEQSFQGTTMGISHPQGFLQNMQSPLYVCEWFLLRPQTQADCFVGEHPGSCILERVFCSALKVNGRFFCLNLFSTAIERQWPVLEEGDSFQSNPDFMPGGL